MDAEGDTFKPREPTQRIIGIFYEVYNELGHGFLESVYEEAMSIALAQTGLSAERQIPLKVGFRGVVVGDFRADMLVENAVLVELKAGRQRDPSREAQLLNYLRATEIEVGLLLNFGPKPQFKRLAFDNRRKQIGVFRGDARRDGARGLLRPGGWRRRPRWSTGPACRQRRTG